MTTATDLGIYIYMIFHCYAYINESTDSTEIHSGPFSRKIKSSITAATAFKWEILSVALSSLITSSLATRYDSSGRLIIDGS